MTDKHRLAAWALCLCLLVLAVADARQIVAVPPCGEHGLWRGHTLTHRNSITEGQAAGGAAGGGSSDQVHPTPPRASGGGGGSVVTSSSSRPTSAGSSHSGTHVPQNISKHRAQHASVAPSVPAVAAAAATGIAGRSEQTAGGGRFAHSDDSNDKQRDSAQIPTPTGPSRSKSRTSSSSSTGQVHPAGDAAGGEGRQPGNIIISSSSSSSHVPSSLRHLQQSSLCPDGCAPEYCVPAGLDPAAGFKCQQCLGSLVVDKATGKCGCPAGRYASSANSCTDCPKSSYCDGGVYVVGPPLQPIKRACPDSMTTLGLRSISARSCVNLPGTYFTIDASGTVGAVVCPVNSYGPGFKKQRACVPCPTNYKTNGLTGRTSPLQCVVPPGFYLKMPGVVAPCPMGEYKEGVGSAPNCTKCAFGVSTPSDGSTSAAACSVLIAGNYAVTLEPSGEISAAAACPQKYYCPGGVPGQAFAVTNPAGLDPAEPSIKQCPDGSWTQERGAVAPEQCLTPPGYFTAGGSTQRCPDGAFRADWLAPMQATACTACGSGVQGDKSDRITEYNLVTGAATLVPVMTSSSDCFIQRGQGLFYSSVTQTFRARNCENNMYGVPSRFYGLTPYPCRPCPTGMVASNNSGAYPTSASWWADNGDGTRGFYSVKACVTQPGYGYNSRVAAPCPVGSFNQKDNYGSCTRCPVVGTTTAGVGAGVTAADCGVAAGYGSDSGSIAPCAVGTYNDVAYTPGLVKTCSVCATGTTTASTGADQASDCSLCAAGYGGDACSTVCGGSGASATYGPPGRPVGTACTACTTSPTGYSFEWNGGNDLFSPQPVSRLSASSSISCVTEFAQFADGAWWLPTTSNTSTTITSSVATFSDCVATCTSGVECQYVTYDYTTATCFTRIGQPPVLAGTPWVGFKAVPSGDVGSTWSIRGNSTSTKTAASGLYTWWADPNHASIGIQSAAPGANTFTTIQDCLSACDDNTLCAGVVIRQASNSANTPKTCVLIFGDTTIGVFKRSMTRADTSRQTIPL